MIRKSERIIILALRLGFGVLLIGASAGKIGHPVEFAQAVENYRVIGEGLSRWTAVWLPCLELATGLLLVFGIWAEAAALMNSLLMSAFFVLVVQAYLRHLDILCGCFSIDGGSRIGLLKILENFLFMAGSILLVWLTFGKKGVISKRIGSCNL